MASTISRWPSPAAIFRLPLFRRPTNPPPHFSPSFPRSVPAFSTRQTLLEKNPHSSPELKNGEQAHKGSEPPTFSLKALGLSKNMRLGVLTLLGIFGTIETWFYCQWALRWWRGDGEKEAQSSGGKVEDAK